jgi:hypothetical protein
MPGHSGSLFSVSETPGIDFVIAIIGTNASASLLCGICGGCVWDIWKSSLVISTVNEIGTRFGQQLKCSKKISSLS